MTKDELKRRVWEAVDRRGEEIIGLGEEIRRHPELGFKEIKTARLVEETFRKLGLAPRAGLALTGVRADAPGRTGAGPTFAVLGELDALVVAGHPEGDPQPGARGEAGVPRREARALAARSLRRRRPRDDDPRDLTPGGRQGGGARLQQ